MDVILIAHGMAIRYPCWFLVTKLRSFIHVFDLVIRNPDARNRVNRCYFDHAHSFFVAHVLNSTFATTVVVITMGTCNLLFPFTFHRRLLVISWFLVVTSSEWEHQLYRWFLSTLWMSIVTLVSFLTKSTNCVYWVHRYSLLSFLSLRFMTHELREQEVFQLVLSPTSMMVVVWYNLLTMNTTWGLSWKKLSSLSIQCNVV